MNIRITPLDIRPEVAMAQLDSIPGLVSAHVLRPMDQQQSVLVTVWGTEANADSAAVTAGGRHYLHGQVLRTGRLLRGRRSGHLFWLSTDPA